MNWGRAGRVRDGRERVNKLRPTHAEELQGVICQGIITAVHPAAVIGRIPLSDSCEHLHPALLLRLRQASSLGGECQLGVLCAKAGLTVRVRVAGHDEARIANLGAQ